MSHFRAFERPLGAFNPPPLTLTGSLPGYKSGVAYEGRLQIGNSIGDCTAELIAGSLPPGATLRVDNRTKEVVIAWPAFLPNPVPAAIPNANFDDGNDGWTLGAGWAIEQHPADVRHTGTGVAVFRGGSADSYIHSSRFPCKPSVAITASALWDQGPSNKRNVDCYSGLTFYNAAGEPFAEFWGNKIHDANNEYRHVSTVNAVSPAGTEQVSFTGYVHRRRYARPVSMDDVTWNLMTQEPTVGINTYEDFPITIRVHDSANRFADWSGAIEYESFYLTSKLYGIVLDEHVGVGFAVSGLEHKLGSISQDAPNEFASVGYSITGFQVIPAPKPEAAEQLGVTYTLTSFIFKDPRVLQSDSAALGVSFSLSSFALKAHPTAGSSDAATISYSLQGFTIT